MFGVSSLYTTHILNISSKDIRTSLSPEVYARAARTGMPLPVKKRPHVYNNPNNPGPDVDMEPRQESNRLRQLEAHPVLSNESRENSRNNPTDTDDMDETPDPIGPGNADSRVELPQIYANRWIPNQAARTSDLKDRYGGCWCVFWTLISRLKYEYLFIPTQVLPYQTSCESILKTVIMSLQLIAFVEMHTSR